MKPQKQILFLLFLGGLVLLPFFRNSQAGQEFRSFQAIPTPEDETQKQVDLQAEGYQAVASHQVLPAGLVDKVVYQLFDAWNSPDLPSKLSKDFANTSRILDAIQSGVPRQVRLQVLAIQNPRIVGQYVRPHPSGDGSYQVLSKVSVQVRSQVAASTNFLKSFQRVDGTSEYLINITQRVRAL